MRIVEFGLHRDKAAHEVRSRSLGNGLTVFFGPPATGKTTTARFLAHLLYGKPDPGAPLPGARPTEAAPDHARATTAAGHVDITSAHGRYRLRRFLDANHKARLTISPIDGPAVGPETFQKLHAGVPAGVLADLYTLDFSGALPFDRILSADFASKYQASLAAARGSAVVPSKERVLPGQGSRPLNALIARRDELAQILGHRMAEQRARGEQLAAESNDLEKQLTEGRKRHAEVAARARRLEEAISALEARLRYFRSSESIGRELDAEFVERLNTRLADLDQEIQHCRQVIGQLERREANIRRETTRQCPDERTLTVLLADQRVRVHSTNRLLGDLQGELASLARSIDSVTCACRDIHPRLEPIIKLLCEQVAELDRLTSDQQRSVEYADLRAELGHVTRARVDLHQQLEYLLERRQSLLRSARPRLRSSADTEATTAAREVDDDDWITDSGIAKCGAESRAIDAQGATAAEKIDWFETRRAQLECQREQLRQEESAAAAAVQAIERQGAAVDRQRAALLADPSLREVERELAVLRQRLESGDTPVGDTGANARETAPGLRASDFLAQLTNRRYVRLEMHGSVPTLQLTDRAGGACGLGDLSESDRKLAYLSLSLALVARHAENGIHLPLSVDEPGADLSPEQEAALASVLHAFARRGHQVIVFTSSRSLADRFHAAGADVREPSKWRILPEPASRHVPLEGATAPEVQHESRRHRDDPVSATVPANGATASSHSLSEVNSNEQATQADRKPLFTLRLDDPIDSFPALGSQTNAVFERLGIRRIGDLLAADPVDVASRLSRPSITAPVVQLWQVHLALMCFVPGVSLEDAQVLTGAGISGPDDLAKIVPANLYAQVHDYLAGERGKRFAGRSKRYTRKRVATWVRDARESRSRWRRSAAYRQWHGVASAASGERAA